MTVHNMRTTVRTVFPPQPNLLGGRSEVAPNTSPLQLLRAHATPNARVHGMQGFQGPLSLLARRDV